MIWACRAIRESLGFIDSMCNVTTQHSVLDYHPSAKDVSEKDLFDEGAAAKFSIPSPPAVVAVRYSCSKCDKFYLAVKREYPNSASTIPRPRRCIAATTAT